LSGGGDLLFYGCDLASSSDGQGLLESVQLLTGADVAASIDDTGAAILGANWDLEYELGRLKSAVAFSASTQAEWFGPLDAAMLEAAGLDAAPVESDASTESDSSIDQTSFVVTTDQSQIVSHEVVFLDTSVYNYQQLLDDLWANADSAREFEVVLLNGSRDGIVQITDALAGRTGIDAVHIVSHGTDTAVKLGSTWLTAENLSGYAGEISGWSNSLTTDADLLFYGCGLADSEDGKLLVDSLSALTEADVAASADDTGHSILGGDWDLEYRAGVIETNVAFSDSVQENWLRLLNAAPAGGEVLVNTTTAGTQLTFEEIPQSVAMDADGDYVVVWASEGEDQGTTWGVYAQRYDASGVAQGSEFLVNTTTAKDQMWPSVTMDADGDFVVAWESNLQDGSGYGVYAQRYDAAGVAQGGEFQLNTYTTADQASPIMAMDADGDFVITWDSVQGDFTEIYAQRYNIAGAGPHTIQPLSALPTITDAVVIDGSTETDFSTPVVQLDNNSTLTYGLQVSGDGSTIRGISVTRFDEAGISLTGDNNTVTGSYIGLNADGTTNGLAQKHGVLINGPSNVIGGAAAVDRNIIVGNWYAAITINGGAANSNVVQGNYVGALAGGNTLAADTFFSIYLANTAANNIIGTDGDGTSDVIEGNVIAGETFSVGGGTPSGTVVAGNLIGTNAAGTANLGGSLTLNGSTSTRVGTDGNGTSDSLEANVIANQFCLQGANTGEIVAGNFIGVTANDLDSGPNGLQNSSVLTSAVADDGLTITIDGSLSSTASTTFRIEFFASATADPSGFGEAERFRGSTSVMTDGSGATSFNAVLSAFAVDGEFITATATVDSVGNFSSTSEFSANVVATEVNEAPTLSNGVLSAVNETASNHAGSPLTDVFSGVFSDPGGGSSFAGVAVIGNTANSLTVRGLDDSYAGAFSTTAGSETRVNVDSSVNGGSTAIAASSATVSTYIRAINGDPLLIVTPDDVTGSGAPGLDAWPPGEVLEFDNPNLSFDRGTTSGTFGSFLNLDTFTAAGNTEIDAVHYVTTNITVGSANSGDLQPGDVLLSTALNETLTSTTSISVLDDDVFVFQPDTAGDYSSGSFIFLLDAPLGLDVGAVALVEQETIVGDATLPVGSFLMIAGNVSHGLELVAGNNIVEGNLIGTDVTGLVDLGNGANGADFITAWAGGGGPVAIADASVSDGDSANFSSITVTVTNLQDGHQRIGRRGRNAVGRYERHVDHGKLRRCHRRVVADRRGHAGELPGGDASGAVRQLVRLAERDGSHHNVRGQQRDEHQCDRDDHAADCVDQRRAAGHGAGFDHDERRHVGDGRDVGQRCGLEQRRDSDRAASGQRPADNYFDRGSEPVGGHADGSNRLHGRRCRNRGGIADRHRDER
jgi:hypothetical protein